MPKEELKKEILYSLGDKPIHITQKSIDREIKSMIAFSSFPPISPETREEYEIKLLNWRIKKKIADKLLKEL